MRFPTRRRCLLIVVLCLLAASALASACASPRATAAAPPLQGFGVGTGSGGQVAAELDQLGVSWYTDWTHNTPDVPGHERLYIIKGWVPAADAAAAARAHRGAWWAIGNEPNDPNQDNQSPAAYAAFFRDVAQAIRRTDPSARILSAGIANADWRWAQQFREEYRQLTGSYPAVDGWNIHNYLLGGRPGPVRCRRVQAACRRLS